MDGLLSKVIWKMAELAPPAGDTSRRRGPEAKVTTPTQAAPRRPCRFLWMTRNRSGSRLRLDIIVRCERAIPRLRPVMASFGWENGRVKTRPYLWRRLDFAGLHNETSLPRSMGRRPPQARRGRILSAPQNTPEFRPANPVVIGFSRSPSSDCEKVSGHPQPEGHGVPLVFERPNSKP